jgi:predicted RNase H-like HicB family nuclease
MNKGKAAPNHAATRHAPFRYRIVVEWSEEDGLFVARVPALPGCAAHGATPEHATREARVAAEGILSVMRRDGDRLPPPDIAADYSGQLRLRIPRSLHEKLARLASAEGVSLNAELVSLLAEGCGARGTKLRERHPARTGR